MPQSRDEAAVISLTRNEFPAFMQPLGFENTYNCIHPFFVFFGACTTIDKCVFPPTQGYWGPRAFIAAQTPLPDAVADFWSMVYQKRVCTVVMLSDCSEGEQVVQVL